MGQHRIFAEILEPSPSDVRWVAVHDLYMEVIEYERLPPGSDVLRAYLMTLLRYNQDGWRLGKISSVSPSCFATRAGAKVRIEITALDPRVPFKQQNMHRWPGTNQPSKFFRNK